MTLKQAESWLLKHGAQVRFAPAQGSRPAQVAVQLDGCGYERPGQGRTLIAAIRDLRRQATVKKP